MDILIEDLEGSLWVAAIDKKSKIQNLEIDPYAEIVRWGSIYMGKVGRIDAANDAAYIDLGYGYEGILFRDDVRLDGAHPPKSKKIGQLLSPGQMIMVQVKTAFNPLPSDIESDQPQKVSKLSMEIALQGRYLIHTPYARDNRISKRIISEDMRKNLKSMLKNINDIDGCILRASAANCQTDILVREGKILKAIWDNLLEFEDESEPALLMMGPNALQRTLADLAGVTVGSISVSTMEIFEEAEEWCDLFAPDLMTKIQPRAAENTRSGMGLFEIHDLIGQFEGLLKPYIVLPSGGSIIMEHTSAMTTIDVNSGADKNKLNTNLEAAREIARQLRIRNIGGIVMADFINMKTKADKNKVLKELDSAFVYDPCTTQCHGITELGVFEISRQRRTPTLEEKLILFEQGEEDFE